LRIGGWLRTTTAVILFEISCLGSLIVLGVSPLLTWFPWCLSRHKVVPQQRLRSWRRNCKRLKWCFEPSKPRFGQLLPCTPGRTWNRAREMKGRPIPPGATSKSATCMENAELRRNPVTFLEAETTLSKCMSVPFVLERHNGLTPVR
jgi:hypothetical protein